MGKWRRRGVALAPWALLVVVGGAIALFAWQDLETAAGHESIAFAHPWALVLLGGCALLAWVQFHLRASRTASFLFSRVPDLASTRQGVVARLAALPMVFRICALALIAVALARPQTYRTEDVEVEGIDIMIVLDLSKSMEERDLRRNRLDAGQRTIREFLTRRENDRIGLVVFAEEAMLQSPLTLDYKSLDQIVASLQIGDVPEMGTAIGDGLGLALASLRRTDTASKVVILISDGDSNVDSEMDPKAAKEAAKDMGVRVFTILMGQELGGRPRMRSRYSVNPALLREIARDTNGIYFNAGDDRELEQAFSTVRATLDKSRHRVTKRKYDELYPRLLLMALVLLGLELLAVFTRWRRFP